MDESTKKEVQEYPLTDFWEGYLLGMGTIMRHPDAIVQRRFVVGCRGITFTFSEKTEDQNSILVVAEFNGTADEVFNSLIQAISGRYQCLVHMNKDDIPIAMSFIIPTC